MEMIHLRTAKQLRISIVNFFLTFLEHQNVPTIDGEDRPKLTKSMDYRFFFISHEVLQSYHIGSDLDAFPTSSTSEFQLNGISNRLQKHRSRSLLRAAPSIER